MSGRFQALIAVEGLPTTDGRLIVRGGLQAVPAKTAFLRFSGRDKSGHGSTEVGGRFTSIRRRDCWMLANGEFSDDEPGEFLADAVATAAGKGDPLGIGLDLWMDDDAVPDPDGLLRLESATVLGATVYVGAGSTPAWPQCRIVPAP